jgi:hypothetical protein
MEFIGEVGVRERIRPVRIGRRSEDEHDPSNPLGDESGRRNYGETVYLSGMPEKEPAEYDVTGLKFYPYYDSRERPFAPWAFLPPPALLGH